MKIGYSEAIDAFLNKNNVNVFTLERGCTETRALVLALLDQMGETRGYETLEKLWEGE